MQRFLHPITNTPKVITALLLGSLYSDGQDLQIKPYAPELFPPSISGAVCGFSSDGSKIYFAREDTVAKQIHLYEATRNKKTKSWTNARLLPFSGHHSDIGGRLSPDGKKFYFTSDRPGGSTDASDAWNIWMSERSGDGWTTPQPLSEINNKGLECCPVPLSNGTLLFSGDRDRSTSWWISEWSGTESLVATLNQENAWQWPSSLNSKATILFLNSMKRPDTRGMDDIYVSFFDGTNWGTPKNLGPPVNTEAYEDGAILTPDEEWLIFCRHATATTPSQVLQVKWKPLVKGMRQEAQK